jgi:hypothetical protein
MKVECAFTGMRDTETLIPHPRNPNKHPDNQIKLLAKIMNHQGWRHPIIVSERSGFVISGHGRLEAAKINGWGQCPVDIQKFKNEADEYAHMVADNKIAELADTDLSMVNEDVMGLGPDFDLELLGIPDFVIEPINFEPGILDDQGKLDQKIPLITQCPSCGECFDANENKPED